MERIEKVVELKDGSSVLIRNMIPEDLEKSFAFFEELPDEDREYLRSDVTQRDIVARRIGLIENGTVQRLVAISDEKIVADGSLERDQTGWKSHMAELRMIIAHSYQRKGLGLLMARELYGLAAACQVEEIVVRMMEPQKAARAIFAKLGFQEEAVLTGYVRDVHGHKQDMILMRCDLEAMWREIEVNHYFSDWQFQV